MTLAEALTQLRAWCDRSRGEPIEIAPGITGSFQSRGTFSTTAVREIEAAAQPEVERFCFVGEHRCMGDMMGFCIDRPGPANFDIYCHEYPFEEYVAVSDEIKSWREFGPYVAGVVSRFGRDSL